MSRTLSKTVVIGVATVVVVLWLLAVDSFWSSQGVIANLSKAAVLAGGYLVVFLAALAMGREPDTGLGDEKARPSPPSSKQSMPKHLP